MLDARRFIAWALAASGLALLSLGAAGCGGGDKKGSGQPPDADAGSWRTWVIPSGDAVRAPPPPAAGSAAEARDKRMLQQAQKGPTASQRGEIAAWAQRPVIKPWVDLSLKYVSELPKDPPRSSRAYALMTVAMYDAAIASSHWKYRYKRKAPDGRRDPSYPADSAAIAGAASRVLAYAFPNHSAGRLDQMAESAARSTVEAGKSYASDAAAGLALGRSVGDAVIARARKDGYTRRWNGRRPHFAGAWQPPPGSAARPVQPLAGEWRTWVLRSGRDVRPGPPPKYGSPEFIRQARELVQLKAHQTPEQKRIAQFWAGGAGTPLPAGIWNQVMLEYLRDRDLSLPRLTRVFALLNVAQADAGVASWDAKYKYWTTRPENAIRDLHLARGWKPLIKTPFFPSYVSGHATYSGAAAQVLGYLFPDDAALFEKKAQEAAMSRLYGGIHYRADSVVGLQMGKKIGRAVVARAKQDGAGQ